MDEKSKIQDILSRYSVDAKKILLKVLEAEKEKLYLGRPHGINDDLLKIFKETIK